MTPSSLRQSLILGCAIAIVSACATHAPRDKALVQTDRRSTIVRLDGENVSRRRAVVPPGDHSIRFQTSTGLLLFSPTCGVELRLKPGASYTFSTEVVETRLPRDVLGGRWRQLEATSFLSYVADAATEATKLALPCTSCITFRSTSYREEVVQCRLYRANVRIEELCRARAATDLQRCVRDARDFTLATPSSPGESMLFVPGLDAEYSGDARREAFDACIMNDTPDVTACLAARGWEAVP